jgi:sugar phosphate isomerase/epimerase
VLLETHDDFVNPGFVRRVMEATDHPAVGVLWDVGEQFRIIGRPADEVWRDLGTWVKACDLKDSIADLSAPMGYRFVKTGEGELPLRDTLKLLVDNGYDGWLTLEWEKRWQPDIAEPEEVFPHYVRTVRDALARL